MEWLFVKYWQSLTKSGYLLSIENSSSWWIVKFNPISSEWSNQFLHIDDWFHQGEGFNQVSEVHQENEFNDGDQLHHADEPDQYC